MAAQTSARGSSSERRRVNPGERKHPKDGPLPSQNRGGKVPGLMARALFSAAPSLDQSTTKLDNEGLALCKSKRPKQTAADYVKGAREIWQKAQRDRSERAMGKYTLPCTPPRLWMPDMPCPRLRMGKVMIRFASPSGSGLPERCLFPPGTGDWACTCTRL